jgi:hypothetical protein
VVPPAFTPSRRKGSLIALTGEPGFFTMSLNAVHFDFGRSFRVNCTSQRLIHFTTSLQKQFAVQAYGSIYRRRGFQRLACCLTATGSSLKGQLSNTHSLTRLRAIFLYGLGEKIIPKPGIPSRQHFILESHFSGTRCVFPPSNLGID